MIIPVLLSASLTTTKAAKTVNFDELLSLYNTYQIILAVAIVAIPFFCKLNTNSRFLLKKPTRWAWLIVILTILSLDFKCKSDKVQGKKNDHSDSLNKNFIQQQQDRAIRVTQKSKDSIILVLANRYKLLYDSTKSTIAVSTRKSDSLVAKMLRDSVKRVNNYNSQARPVLSLLNLALYYRSKDTLLANLQLACYQSTAYNIDLKVEYFTEYQNLEKHGFSDITTDKRLQEKDNLAAGYKRNLKILITDPNAKALVVHIKGTYTDIPTKKDVYPFEEYVILDLISNKMDVPAGELKRFTEQYFNKAKL